MNWKQFKILVEKQNITDNDEISYIDISGEQIPRIKKYENGLVIVATKYNSIKTEELEKIIDNHRWIELAYKLGQLESISIQLGDETINLRNDLRKEFENEVT